MSRDCHKSRLAKSRRRLASVVSTVLPISLCPQPKGRIVLFVPNGATSQPKVGRSCVIIQSSVLTISSSIWTAMIERALLASSFNQLEASISCLVAASLVPSWVVCGCTVASKSLSVFAGSGTFAKTDSGAFIWSAIGSRSGLIGRPSLVSFGVIVGYINRSVANRL